MIMLSDAISLGCSCSQTVIFLKLIVKQERISLIIFFTKIYQNRHFQYENLLSIHENINYCQIMWVIATCKKYQIALTVYENIFSKTFSMLILWKCFLKEFNTWKISLKNVLVQRVKCLLSGCGHNDCNLLWSWYVFLVNLITLSNQTKS